MNHLLPSQFINTYPLISKNKEQFQRKSELSGNRHHLGYRHQFYQKSRLLEKSKFPLSQVPDMSHQNHQSQAVLINGMFIMSLYDGSFYTTFAGSPIEPEFSCIAQAERFPAAANSVILMSNFGRFSSQRRMKRASTIITNFLQWNTKARSGALRRRRRKTSRRLRRTTF